MTINLRTIHTIIIIVCLAVVPASAQRFYNLTAKDVRVDSIVPVFSHSESLPPDYRDSLYTYEIAYPEFVDMPAADIRNYCRLTSQLPPAMPSADTRVVMDRKQPSLAVTFCPVVYRNGRYQVLASFMLRREARAKGGSAKVRRAGDTTAPADRYAAHSVLRSGKWAKIRVPSSGFYQLTDALVRQAGFSSLAKVKVYGYGGNLQNEVLDADELIRCDDLKEVPTVQAGNRRVFYGFGPVSWKEGSSVRTRNPYSDYGYYFLTDDGTDPQVQDSATFVAAHPEINDNHQIYEVDGYSYFQGGRNLFDSRQLQAGDSLVVEFDNTAYAPAAGYDLTVAIASAGSASVEVSANGNRMEQTVATSGSVSEHVLGFRAVRTFSTWVARNSQSDKERIVLRVASGSPARLDFVSLAWNVDRSIPNLSTAALPVPEYVYNITNQDHHADPQADMVIIIPTSQKLLAQAKRLKTFHEEHDGMRVNIVPADELFNEFSSGTPDASAYRHYMKMLYDRAATAADMPKYLVMFGASVWDNRMLTPACKALSPDDYLLAYESENSFDKRYSYVDDGFYCMLDDGEGGKPIYSDKLDVAVGRFPVTSEADAKVMVDKIIAYADNKSRGSWLNTLFFMGDDGDNNTHMEASNSVADDVIANHPGFMVKKVMWDAYQIVSSSSGYTYPEVTNAVKQQQSQGALVMDYVGHGSEWQFSHENVLKIADFQNFRNTNLPLWCTIGCDFMPFDRIGDNIGSKAVLNPNGGALAVMGSTRTVFATQNAVLHRAFMRYLLSYDSDGKPLGMGEALRLAKNQTNDNVVAANSMQFSLFGDPALPLNMPTAKIVIDSICGADVTGGTAIPQMKAGALMTVSGHVEGHDTFNGTLSLVVRDNEEQIVCRDNQGEANRPFTYKDRTKTLFSGKDKIVDGKFSCTFAVPMDINYSNETGLITAWAVNYDSSVMANGYCDSFTVGGSVTTANDSIGPSVYCYLNSPSFQNGGNVNPTPYFVAEVTDRDGINASGAGVGHDLQLVIDGKSSMTYSLNDNFTFDFGSYTSGSTYYNIPELAEGRHTLQFRAWDILNNVSVAELSFNVVKSQKPEFSISCTDNPAKESTTFIISHDRAGSTLDVTVEVFDMGGRMLWRHNESGVAGGSAYTVAWNLETNGGAQVQPGLYLYRVKLGSEGAVRTSKAKKLIVVGNK